MEIKQVIAPLKFALSGLFLLVLGNSANAQSQYSFSYSTPLIAARTEVIGEVKVERDGDSLDVTYVITDSNWTIDKTYLHVGPTAASIPTTSSGTPDIQNYDFKEVQGGVFNFKYDNIDVTGMPYVYASANASVTEGVSCEVDIDDINAVVPSGQLFMSLEQTGNPQYFRMLLYDFGGNPIFYDYFFGNCVDLTNPIFEGVYYYPYAISSYSTDTALLECIVDKPENLDLVNYIINQDYKTLLGAGGPEIQAAIWTLLDNSLPVNGVFGITWNQLKVNAIIADARAKGEFYIPECDGNVAILLDQGCVDAFNNGTNPSVSVQQSIFWLPVSKVQTSYEYTYGACTNAWGKGTKFSNTAGWGMYFNPF